MRVLLFVVALVLLSIITVAAEEKVEYTDAERMDYYVKYASLDVPWFYLAAIDQYERNIQQVRSDLTKKSGPIAIDFPTEFWAGRFNPFAEDQSILSITFFAGNGKDGNGDKLADPNHPEDVMATLSAYLEQYAYKKKGMEKALLDFYEKEETVHQIMTIAKIFKHFQTITLAERAFPVPTTHNYSYRGTWGMSRGWGGRRIHEGTDVFANYGVPVRSTSYGVIEVMGWNEYGGWRVGVRDAQNTYHYYAHLTGFNKEFKEGDLVEPGAIIGYVGSSGYGKEGTSGKFPPHLHYGMYKYNGRTEWAFDPYPYLRIWERQEQ